jgi:NAD(P)-dependent dehydrogenase (short-subunit alcohol dehydrogenase family)
LGSAISRKLTTQGFNVALHYGKSKSKTLGAEARIEKRGGGDFLVQANLGHPSQSAKLIQQVVDHWGRLDLLSTALPYLNRQIYPQRISKNGRIFLTSILFLPSAWPSRLRPWLEKHKGCVVNITDIYGKFPILKEHAAYSASKGGAYFFN